MSATLNKPAETFDPAAVKLGQPDHRPSRSVAQQRRSGERPEAPLAGTGTIVDNGWDRWHYLVTPGTAGVLTLRLQVADVITWWKGIDVYASLFGRWFSINRHLGTVDSRRVATIDLTPSDAQSSTLKLDFWKAGFRNSGSYLFTRILDVPSSLGKRVTYVCGRDHPRQP